MTPSKKEKLNLVQEYEHGANTEGQMQATSPVRSCGQALIIYKAASQQAPMLPQPSLAQLMNSQPGRPRCSHSLLNLGWRVVRAGRTEQLKEARTRERSLSRKSVHHIYPAPQPIQKEKHRALPRAEERGGLISSQEGKTEAYKDLPEVNS